MCAAEDKDVGFLGIAIKGIVQINPRDLRCDGMVHPSFLDQGHKEWAGFFRDRYIANLKRAPVGMACDSGFGANDHDPVITARPGGSFGAGFDDSDGGHLRRSLDFVKREGGRSVTSNDEQFGSLRLQVLNRAQGVMRDSGGGF